MITIKDIAKTAGVSHTTVSRALRGDPRISPNTTERIVQLASEMGYVPNSIAQSLNAQRTNTIGLLVTTVADPVIGEFLEGAETVAQERGYCIFLSTSRNDPVREIDVVQTFQQRRVDGVIVIASRIGERYRSALDSIQVPLVFISSQESGNDTLTVDVDSIAGARLAVHHLHQLGHQRIGYIGAADRPLSNTQRLAGYRQALAEHQLPIMPQQIAIPDAKDDIKKGWLGLDQCWNAGVTAVFCYNDQIALGVLNACHHKTIAVPQQLSVVGFDDVRAASYVTPTLTTVRQPLHEMGKAAMEMVLDVIDHNPVQSRLFDCELVARSSTASP